MLQARMRGHLPLYELRNGVDASKVGDIKVVTFDGNAAFALNEEYQLHGKQGVDKTQGENVLVVLQFDVCKKLCDKRMNFRVNSFHNALSCLHLLIGVEALPTFAPKQTGIHHLL